MTKIVGGMKVAASRLARGMVSSANPGIYSKTYPEGSDPLESYTGDYIASDERCYWKQLKIAYGRLWGNIGCVQIPHHGSNGNFNDEFLTMSAYNVISAGFGNVYRHPSNAVLAKYRARHKFPFVVTQSQASGFGTVITTWQ